MSKVTFRKHQTSQGRFSGKSFLISMFVDNKFVGDASVQNIGNRAWSIDSIEIYGQYQGRGYGRILVHHIEELAAHSKILVIRLFPYPEAIGFWAAMGYTIDEFDTYKDINPPNY